MQNCLSPSFSLLSRSIQRISRPVRAAFLAAFISGLIIYGYAITNIVLCTGDALNNAIFNGNLIWIGRWSSHWLSALSTDYSLPAVSTLLMILAVSLLAGLAASLLRFRSSLTAVLGGLVLMSHPAVGNILVYLHNADAYMIAALLGVWALWMIDHHTSWWWMLAAIPLLAIGAGTYQAVLSLVVALMFVRAVQRILGGDDDNRTLLLTAGRYAVLFIASLVIYYVMVQVSTAASGLILTDYQSTSTMGQFTVQEFWQNFKGCYADFKQSITFLSFRPGYYVNGYPNYLFTAIVLGLIPVCFCFAKNKTVLKALVVLLLFVLSPLLLCSIRLANPGFVQPRMTYSMACLYLLGLTLAQFIEENWSRLPRKRLVSAGFSACTWIIAICLTVAVFVWSVGINLDLYRGKKEYDHLYSSCTDYLQRAESVDDYNPGMPIYVIGAAENSARQSPKLSEPASYYAFMVHYMDVVMPYGIANNVNDAALQLQQTHQFQSMPCWPAVGCAARFDDSIVIKLGN